MERFFNTAGPQKIDINYSIDPLSRFNLDEMLMSLVQKPRPEYKFQSRRVSSGMTYYVKRKL